MTRLTPGLVIPTDVTQDIDRLSNVFAKATDSFEALNATLQEILYLPYRLSAISKDMQSSLFLLCELGTLLNDNESRPGVIRSTPLSSLTDVAKNCLEVCEDLRAGIQAQRLASSEKRPDNFMEPELEASHNDLIKHKIALKIAFCMANRYAAMSISVHID
jgi:hypothetical protein